MGASQAKQRIPGDERAIPLIRLTQGAPPQSYLSALITPDITIEKQQNVRICTRHHTEGTSEDVQEMELEMLTVYVEKNKQKSVVNPKTHMVWRWYEARANLHICVEVLQPLLSTKPPQICVNGSIIEYPKDRRSEFAFQINDRTCRINIDVDDVSEFFSVDPYLYHLFINDQLVEDCDDSRIEAAMKKQGIKRMSQYNAPPLVSGKVIRISQHPPKREEEVVKANTEKEEEYYFEGGHQDLYMRGRHAGGVLRGGEQYIALGDEQEEGYSTNNTTSL